MAIYTYLDVSTGYAPQYEIDMISEPGSRLATTIGYEYGVFVHVDPDGTSEELRNNAPNVAKVIDAARDLACLWVRFDADGDQDALPGFPFFDW